MEKPTQEQVERIAKVCHEANRAYCETIGDRTQLRWEDAPDWQRVSARAGVLHILSNPAIDAQQTHEAWRAQKIKDGWVYGPEKNPERKTHPALVPYEALPTQEQAKDKLFKGVVLALAAIGE